jgi:hypothetical protein
MLDAFDFSQQDCGSARLSIIRRSEAVKPFQFLSFRLSGTLESQTNVVASPQPKECTP